MPHNDPTIRELLGDVIDSTTKLIRQELRLAQAETSQKLAHAQHRLIAIVAGLLLGFCALLILLQAVVVSLALVMPAWLASVSVGAILMIGAIVLIKYGQHDLSAEDFAPKRTLRSVQKDKDMVMEKVR